MISDADVFPDVHHSTIWGGFGISHIFKTTDLWLMQEQVYLKIKIFLLEKGFAFVLILVFVKFSGIF